MPPILSTRRLQLRPPHPDDVEYIYQLGSNPRVMRYITGGKTQTREQAYEDLHRRIRQSRGVLGYWVAFFRDTNEFVGWLALKPLDETQRIEVGYRLLEAQWGKGLATEAAQAILSYAFEELQLPEVWSVAMEANQASIRVMEKLGLTYVERGRYYDTDCVCYRILYETYRRRHPSG